MGKTTLKNVTVADAYLSILADRGIDYLFANAGTDFTPLIEALAKAQALGTPTPIPITCPHENTAQHMAIGYYLATGRQQLTMMHVNVGTANGLNGLLNAQRGGIPMLFTAGRTPVNEDTLPGHRSLDIHWTQEMYDQAGMLREAVKWDYELRNSVQLETVVDRALSVSMSEPRGPVYLALPREILAQEMSEYTYNSPTRVQPATAPAPDAEALDEIAALLAKAERPLLITNWGGRNPNVMALLTDLADRFALPVVEFRNRYVAMPPLHPMHAGHDPNPYIENADVIMIIDCAAPWLPSQVRPPEKCKVIHMAVDPMYGFVPIRGFEADISVSCATDVGLSLLSDAMESHIGSASTQIENRRQVQTKRHKEQRETLLQKLEDDKRKSTISYALLSHSINEIRDADTVIIKESSLLQQYIETEKPLTMINAGAASGLGHGLGVALGVKLADRDRMVIATEGDGAYIFNNPLSCHYVAAEQDLPVITIVFNNQHWQAVDRATKNQYPDGYAAQSNRQPLTHFTVDQHYEKAVEVAGGYGEQVTDPKELMSALERAKKITMVDKRQALLNVTCVGV